ncbi:MAG: methyltransferase domain-containing protein [Candidatus Krumholzibacteriota bacterium]|nr:methyltransferase domain-containing protein [Candidatus Krumholzibacteriota bacterium]
MTETYAEKLANSDRLREGTIRRAIAALGPPSGSRGLDAGCGIGSHTFMLAEAVGIRGQVVGLDISDELLAVARRRAAREDLNERISFQRVDAASLTFLDNSFDWYWSVDCVGFAPIDPLPALREAARVLRPGGRVALLFWSSERLLPGFPELEAHLDATAIGIAPFRREDPPERHPMRLLAALGAADFADLDVRTFAGTVHAPLDAATRRALVSLFDMRWDGAEKELSRKDRAEHARLCDAESPDFIGDLPDYVAFFTYTMFTGRVAG